MMGLTRSSVSVLAAVLLLIVQGSCKTPRPILHDKDVSPVTASPTKRHKKLEIISNYQATATNQGPVEQCTIEENMAYIGATLDGGDMRIKSVQSGMCY
jgi:hypothetical protein